MERPSTISTAPTETSASHLINPDHFLRPPRAPPINPYLHLNQYEYYRFQGLQHFAYGQPHRYFHQARDQQVGMRPYVYRHVSERVEEKIEALSNRVDTETGQIKNEIGSIKNEIGSIKTDLRQVQLSLDKISRRLGVRSTSHMKTSQRRMYMKSQKKIERKPIGPQDEYKIKPVNPRKEDPKKYASSPILSTDYYEQMVKTWFKLNQAIPSYEHKFDRIYRSFVYMENTIPQAQTKELNKSVYENAAKVTTASRKACEEKFLTDYRKSLKKSIANMQNQKEKVLQFIQELGYFQEKEKFMKQISRNNHELKEFVVGLKMSKILRLRKDKWLQVLAFCCVFKNFKKIYPSHRALLHICQLKFTQLGLLQWIYEEVENKINNINQNIQYEKEREIRGPIVR